MAGAFALGSSGVAGYRRLSRWYAQNVATDVRVDQVDVSDFRENLDHFLESPGAVRVARDGEIIGVYTPLPKPEKVTAEEADEHWTKYEELQTKLLADMEKNGVTEEDLMRDVEELQRRKRAIRR